MGDVFLDTAVFDLADIGQGRLEGLAAIRRFMELDAHHPHAHHVTNVHLLQRGAVIQASSRLIALLENGTARSGRYLDELVRTPGGWRISKRTFLLRRR